MKKEERYRSVSLYAGPITWLGILLFLFLTGCKTAKKIETIQVREEKTEEVFFGQMAEKAFQYQTLDARLDAEIVLPGKELSSRISLKILRDSLFQLSVQPLLGIEVFRIVLSTERVVIIDRLNKRYVDESYADLKGKTPIDFNFYNLQALFTNHLFLPGEPSVEPAKYHRFRLEQEGASRVIKTKDQTDLLYTFFADGEEKLLSTDIRNQLETYILQWNYTNFRLVGEQPFPMQMNIQLQKNGSLLGKTTLNFSRIDTDKSIEIDPSTPSKYERVTVDQILKALSNKKK